MGDDAMIKIQGARQHNLKNLNLEIPRNRFIVITGVSGTSPARVLDLIARCKGAKRTPDTP